MNPTTWQRIKPIIMEAMDLPEPDWPGFLARALGGDPQLIGEALSFLQTPAMDLKANALIEKLFNFKS